LLSQGSDVKDEQVTALRNFQYSQSVSGVSGPSVCLCARGLAGYFPPRYTTIQAIRKYVFSVKWETVSMWTTV